MHYAKNPYLQITIIILCLFIISCNSAEKRPVEKKIVEDPKEMDEMISESIRETLDFAMDNNGKIDDTVRLNLAAIVNNFYSAHNDGSVWSSKEKWQPLADSLFQYILHAEEEGLFPSDYQIKKLQVLKNKLDTDSLKRMDAVLWTKADLMLTDAFMRIIKDLKYGRLQPDSITINKDSLQAGVFLVKSLEQLLIKKEFGNVLQGVQPVHKGYWELKNGIRPFLDSMDKRVYTYVTYPYKKGNAKDSLYFIKTLQKRLFEGGAIFFMDKLPDSLQLNTAIQKYRLTPKT